MSGLAEIEACHERLHRTGWSIGDMGMSSGWLVTGTNGDNVILADGRNSKRHRDKEYAAATEIASRRRTFVSSRSPFSARNHEKHTP